MSNTMKRAWCIAYNAAQSHNANLKNIKNKKLATVSDFFNESLKLAWKEEKQHDKYIEKNIPEYKDRHRLPYMHRLEFQDGIVCQPWTYELGIKEGFQLVWSFVARSVPIKTAHLVEIQNDTYIIKIKFSDDREVYYDRNLTSVSFDYIAGKLIECKPTIKFYDKKYKVFDRKHYNAFC